MCHYVLSVNNIILCLYLFIFCSVYLRLIFVHRAIILAKLSVLMFYKFIIFSHSSFIFVILSVIHIFHIDIVHPYILFRLLDIFLWSVLFVPLSVISHICLLCNTSSSVCYINSMLILFSLYLFISHFKYYYK
jgi:hypothetical protein